MCVYIYIYIYVYISIHTICLKVYLYHILTRHAAANLLTVLCWLVL